MRNDLYKISFTEYFYDKEVEKDGSCSISRN